MKALNVKLSALVVESVTRNLASKTSSQIIASKFEEVVTGRTLCPKAHLNGRKYYPQTV